MAQLLAIDTIPSHGVALLDEGEVVRTRVFINPTLTITIEHSNESYNHFSEPAKLVIE